MRQVRCYPHRVPRPLPLLVTMLAVALCSSPVPRANEQPSFHSGTTGVRVDVLVTDRHGPIAGLTAADFDVRDDGVLQAVTLIDHAEVPINLVLTLDTSGSATGLRQTHLVSACGQLLDGLLPGDRAGLIIFSHSVVRRLPLSNDVAAVRSSLEHIRPYGRTAVMDAVYVALTTTLEEPGRSLVVVFTDAADISSWLQPGEVEESAKRSNAVLYAVVPSDVRQVSLLERLTRATGGSLLRVASTANLADVFKQILQAFRSRYVLAYTPTGVTQGGYHRLDVRVRRHGATVFARPGYIGLEAKR